MSCWLQSEEGFKWVCSSCICLPNAKPAKIRTNRKKGLKKFSATLQSHYFLYLMKSGFVSRHFSCLIVRQEFCILLFGFCFFFSWFLSGSVGENTAWTKLKSELLYGIHGLGLRLFAHSSSSPKKITWGSCRLFYWQTLKVDP